MAPRFASSCAIAFAIALAVAGGSTGSQTQAPSPGDAAALAAPVKPLAIADWRIYFVMTDRYANGDQTNDRGGYGPLLGQNGYDPTSTAWWHGGDFRGLTGSCTDTASDQNRGHGLQRIKDLGFNAIWLTTGGVTQIALKPRSLIRWRPCPRF